jgi:glyoxylase-like metal-dependent hydrolase (beta-lactamase superfamily II)
MAARAAVGRTGGYRIVSDGVAAYNPADVFPDVPPEERAAMLSGRLLPDGSLPVPYSPLLVHTDRGPILVDAGAGEALAAEWGDPVGRTSTALAAAGVTPADVAMVLITHAHADHVGGLTVEQGGERVPRYPNARHVLSATEWAYWIDGEHPPGFRSWLASLARLHLVPLRRAGLLELVVGGARPAPGMGVIATPGHTPGHVSIEIRTETTELLVLGDLVLHEWNFEHPDWTAVTESDRLEAPRTRRAILGRAAREGAVVHAFHLPTLGRVEASGDAFRFVPLE